MRIYREKNYSSMSRRVASFVAAQVVNKPDSVLALATGSTPIGTYEQLVKWYREGVLDFSKVRTINLDEYKGMNPENEQSYHYYMKTNLFDHINIQPENTHLPNGLEMDEEKECKRYDALIDSLGGIDLHILPMGHNGHIGFNEPGEKFAKGTNCIDLTDSTIEANSRFFKSADDVPRKAFTMGIKTIMSAKKIVVPVNGNDKAEILYRALFGEITPKVPASVLQLHPNVIVVADEEAASRLPLN